MSALLEIDQLTVDLSVEGQMRRVVQSVSLDIQAGEAVGLVGESGSGKSMTVRSIVHLLPKGAAVGGDIRFDGSSIAALKGRELGRFLAREIAVVFQDPRSHINPVRTVGDFLVEGLVTTRGVKRKVAEEKVSSLLEQVGIPDAARRLHQRPYELSGGLLQRVMIASALAIEPRLILADEPTTALDVTTQEEVMAILAEERLQRGLAMLFITHDLELAAAVCDRIAVMYAGTIVEVAPPAAIRAHPAHPYTAALMGARPGLNRRGERLTTVPGQPVAAFEAPPGCPFEPRCPLARDVCRRERPLRRPLDQGEAACHFAGEISVAEVAKDG